MDLILFILGIIFLIYMYYMYSTIKLIYKEVLNLKKNCLLSKLDNTYDTSLSINTDDNIFIKHEFKILTNIIFSFKISFKF